MIVLVEYKVFVLLRVEYSVNMMVDPGSEFIGRMNDVEIVLFVKVCVPVEDAMVETTPRGGGTRCALARGARTETKVMTKTASFMPVVSGLTMDGTRLLGAVLSGAGTVQDIYQDALHICIKAASRQISIRGRIGELESCEVSLNLRIP